MHRPDIGWNKEEKMQLLTHYTTAQFFCISLKKLELSCRLTKSAVYVSTSVVDPDPEPYVFGLLGPDPSIKKQKSKNNLDFCYFVTSFWLFIFEDWCKCTFKSNKQKNIKVTDPQHWSDDMVVCLTVGMTLVLKECPAMTTCTLYHTILSDYLMAASTDWASQGMVVCLTVGMTLVLKECPLMATVYHIIWLPYGSQHRVSLTGHGSVSHSRDDPRAQSVPVMAILCTILSDYLMAASTEWASQGMVVSLTVGGMTLVPYYLITLWQPAQSEPRRAW